MRQFINTYRYAGVGWGFPLYYSFFYTEWVIFMALGLIFLSVYLFLACSFETDRNKQFKFDRCKERFFFFFKKKARY